MQVNPNSGSFAEQGGADAGSGVELEQIEAGLAAVEALGGETAVGQPMDAGQIEVILVAQIHPDWRTAIAGDDAEAHAGIGLTGERVAVVFLRLFANGIFALVHNAVDGDMGFIYLGKGQRLTIGRPPKAFAAAQLFLGDVFGEAVGFAATAGVVGDLLGLAVFGGNDVQLGIVDVGDPLTIGGELGVLAGMAASGYQQAQGGAVGVLEVQVVADGDEDTAVFAPGVLGNAKFTLAQPFAAQHFFQRDVVVGDAIIGGGDEGGAVAGLQIEGKELAGEGAFGAEEVGEDTAVWAEVTTAGNVHAGQGELSNLLDGQGGRHG